MNAEDVEIEGLTLEQGLPSMIAAMQFANCGRSTGFNSPEEYERFLCAAVHSRDLPTVLVARRGGKFLGSVNLLVHEMTTRPTLSPWLTNFFSRAPVVTNPGTTYTSNYSYDLNGNLTQIVNGATTTSYSYDYLNRLATSTISSGQTTTYGYDAFGNRVYQTTGNTTTVYPSKWYSITTVSAATSTGTSTDVYLPAQAGLE